LADVYTSNIKEVTSKVLQLIKRYYWKLFSIETIFFPQKVCPVRSCLQNTFRSKPGETLHTTTGQFIWMVASNDLLDVHEVIGSLEKICQGQ
jgi:hypothetical protein